MVAVGLGLIRTVRKYYRSIAKTHFLVSLISRLRVPVKAVRQYSCFTFHEKAMNKSGLFPPFHKGCRRAAAIASSASLFSACAELGSAAATARLLSCPDLLLSLLVYIFASTGSLARCALAAMFSEVAVLLRAMRRRRAHYCVHGWMPMPRHKPPFYQCTMLPNIQWAH